MRWHSRKVHVQKYSVDACDDGQAEKVTLVFHMDQKHLNLMKTGEA